MDLQLAFNAASKQFDLALAGADLATEAGLQAAVVLSLFTDRLAEPGDVLPDATTDRRGWWGDSFTDQAGDRIGSKLWLLGREKQLPSVARRAESYAREALQWLIDDGIATRLNVTAEFIASGAMGLQVEIVRPAGTPLIYRFSTLWETPHAL